MAEDCRKPLDEQAVLAHEELVLKDAGRIDTRHRDGNDPDKRADYLIGVGLSGGGVRSACVALGMLQVFAEKRLIRHVDYLSSVSGGGYTGAALALRYALEARKGENRDPDRVFPFGPGTKDVEHLRHHANYLAPRGAGSFATGFAVVARSILLNGFIWIMVGGVVFAALMALFGEEGRECLLLPPQGCAPTTTVFDFFLIGAASLVAVLVAMMLGVSLSSFWIKSFKLADDERWRLPAVLIAALLVAVWKILPHNGLFPSLNVSAYSGWHLVALALPLLFLLTLLVPLLGPKLPDWLPVLLLGLFSLGLWILAVRYGAPNGIDGTGPVFAGGTAHALLALALLSSLVTTRRLLPLAVRLAAGRGRMANPDSDAAGHPVERPAESQEPGGAEPDGSAELHGAAAVAPAILEGQGISPKYARRRFIEAWSGRLLLLSAVLMVIGLLPALPPLLRALVPDAFTAYWASKGPGIAGVEATDASIGIGATAVYLLAAAAAMFAYWRAHLRGVLGLGTAFVVIVGSLMLLIGTMLIAMLVGQVILAAARDAATWPDLGLENGLILTGVITALALAICVNVNDISLGRFYRDRLMEAFMPNRAPESGDRGPSLGSTLKRKTTDSDQDQDRPATDADRFRLSSIGYPPELSRTATPVRRSRFEKVRGKEQGPMRCALLGPYPLINTYLNARRSAHVKARRRGGANFVLSPRYCGSNETGWKRTEDLIGDESTLATAMATSGAAINPGGGAAGRGLTTNRAVMVAMSLLSLRLGYSFRWHTGNARLDALRRAINPYGNHFIPMAGEIFAELIGRRCVDPAFVELSDGGHFENLGLYELVRRRCGLIVICDGGEEPGASYASFISAMTLIREDFGAEIKLDRTLKGEKAATSPASIVARPSQTDYPSNADFADRGFFLGSVDYAGDAWPKRGLLIYLKSAMIRDLTISSRGYKGANPSFPYETTMDQFFSPEQFEAYREVGELITRQMLAQTKIDKTFTLGRRPPLGTLVASFDSGRRPAPAARLNPAVRHSDAPSGTGGRLSAPRSGNV